MNKIILKFINIYKIYILIALLTLNFPLHAQDKSNFKQVEATGRSILLPENIETSRKRALEVFSNIYFYLCVDHPFG